jgi:hypothetical protein
VCEDISVQKRRRSRVFRGSPFCDMDGTENEASCLVGTTETPSLVLGPLTQPPGKVQQIHVIIPSKHEPRDPASSTDIVSDYQGYESDSKGHTFLSFCSIASLFTFPDTLRLFTATWRQGDSSQSGEEWGPNIFRTGTGRRR